MQTAAAPQNHYQATEVPRATGSLTSCSLLRSHRGRSRRFTATNHCHYIHDPLQTNTGQWLGLIARSSKAERLKSPSAVMAGVNLPVAHSLFEEEDYGRKFTIDVGTLQIVSSQHHLSRCDHADPQPHSTLVTPLRHFYLLTPSTSIEENPNILQPRFLLFASSSSYSGIVASEYSPRTDQCKVSPFHRSIECDDTLELDEKITAMSGYWYHPDQAWDTEDYDLSEAFANFTDAKQQSYPAVAMPVNSSWYQQPVLRQLQLQPLPQPQPQPQPQHPSYAQQAVVPSNVQQQAWSPPQVPHVDQHNMYRSQSISAFPPYSNTTGLPASAPIAGPSTGYLSPDQAARPRSSRAHSAAASVASSTQSLYSEASRSASPSAAEMSRWGTRKQDGTWRCSHPGCTSRSTFTRGCDLRKHYKRHTKSLFCRTEGCPQATEGGFSSRKDRARHEAKHNPTVRCEWEDCPRMFSRVDNMVWLDYFFATACADRFRRKTTYEGCISD